MSQRPAWDPMPAAWEMLTTAPRKRSQFTEDVYFRECWADFTEVFIPTALAQFALLSFKPEALVGRRARPTIELCIQNGFTPITSARFRYTRHSMREMWRYNWDIYTVDRLRLATLMHSSLDTLVVILRDERAASSGIPGAARLAEFKGSAEPARRKPTHLREQLRPPNDVINFVHVADEPADVIREVGILLDHGSRRAVLQAMKRGTDGSDTTLRAVSEEESHHPTHDFDFDLSVDRLARRCPGNSGRIEQLRHLAENGLKLRWDELCAIIDAPSDEVSLWDFVTVACHLIRLERQGRPDLLLD